MARAYPIKLEDITVKRVDISSGPSIVKTYFKILCQDQELGFVTSGQTITLGGYTGNIFIYRKWGREAEIAYSIFDAVFKILRADYTYGASRSTVDETCKLLLNIGLKI